MKIFKQIQKKNKQAILYYFILTFLSFQGFSQSISVSGSDWNVDLTGEITEAGEDFVGTYESANNQILVSMSIPGLLLVGSQATASIHYEENLVWQNNVVIESRRTGSGISGSICLLCSVSGGGSYQVITTNAVSFFTLNTGAGLVTNTRNNIPVQLRLSGITTSIPADNYSAEIVFTISN